MKKPYIRPESRLFAINLAENIAASGTHIETGGIIITGYGNDSYYSTFPDAKVTVAEGSHWTAFSSEMTFYQYGIMDYPLIPDIMSCTVHEE